jgi:4-amino-4-deoxy-L-arabinose transferase-like glycosyltransferase
MPATGNGIHRDRLPESGVTDKRDPLQSESQYLWIGLVILLAVFAIIVAVRLATPDDLGLRDQCRASSYMIDVVQNGNWLWPRDTYGLGSKPPMHPWVGAVAAHLFGGVNRLARTFPSLLGVLISTLTLYFFGRRRIGWRAAFFAAAIFLLCPFGVKMVGLIRSDPLFAAVVLLNALAALRAWERGGGWNVFWLFSIVSTLTKGPVGVLIAVLGLASVVWERRGGRRLPLRGMILPGAAIWAAVSGGWLMWAWSVYGDEVLLEVLGRELLRHAAVGDAGEPALSNFYFAPFYLLTRFGPWSLFTIAAIVGVIRRPAADDARRRLDRFLVCWILGGLVIFGFAGHQRGDLVYPLAAPSALLAGSVLSRLSWLRSARRAFVAVAVFTALALPVALWEYAYYNPRDPWLQRGLATRDAGEKILHEVGPAFPIAYASFPMELQVFQGIWRQGARGLVTCDYLDKPHPAYAAVMTPTSFVANCEEMGVKVYVVYESPETGAASQFGIVGNREELVWADPMEGWITPFELTLRGVRPTGGKSYFVGRTWNPINGGEFAIGEDGGGMTVRNLDLLPATLRLGLRQGERAWIEDHVVDGGETLNIEWPASGRAPRAASGKVAQHDQEHDR